jgi:arabinose-5-phosphate isomerase
MTSKGFTVKDFVKSHPGGTLGKQLLTVDSIMRSGNALPKVFIDASYDHVLSEIENKKLGFTIVCNKDGKLAGIITDGDLRRAIIKYSKDVFTQSARDLMTGGAKTIKANSLAVEALRLMEQHTIADLLITDDQNIPIGVVDLKDLLKAGVI